MNKSNKKKVLNRALILNIILILVTYIGTLSYHSIAFAADEESSQNEEIEDDDTGGDTFYRPKASFMSSDEYNKYCEEMYRHGYMDKNYNWSSAAKEYINNMTEENNKAAFEDGKATVEKRIKNGEMELEDSPYLTSEELEKRQKAAQQKPNTQEDEGLVTDIEDDSMTDDELENSNEDYEETDDDIYDMSDEQDEQEDEKSEEPAQQKKGSLFGKIVMAILICGIAIVSYSIYRRQF